MIDLLPVEFSFRFLLVVNEGDALHAWSAYYPVARSGWTWPVLGWRAYFQDLVKIGDGVHAERCPR